MTLTDLQKFCSTDETLPQICRPFSQGTWTYATDGRVIVRVPRMAEVPEYDDSPSDVEKRTFGASSITNLWRSVPDDLPACVVCDGTGTHLCECGDKHDCRKCHGYGRTDDKRGGIQCGIHLVDPRYLFMLRKLPNVQICDGEDKLSALGIRFDSGDGRLMPMKE